MKHSVQNKNAVVFQSSYPVAETGFGEVRAVACERG